MTENVRAINLSAIFGHVAIQATACFRATLSLRSLGRLSPPPARSCEFQIQGANPPCGQGYPSASGAVPPYHPRSQNLACADREPPPAPSVLDRPPPCSVFPFVRLIACDQAGGHKCKPQVKAGRGPINQPGAPTRRSQFTAAAVNDPIMPVVIAKAIIVTCWAQEVVSWVDESWILSSNPNERI